MTFQVNNSISLPLTYEYSRHYIFKGTVQFLTSLVYSMGSTHSLSFFNMLWRNGAFACNKSEQQKI